MSENEGAAAPATEQAVTAPAETEPATPTESQPNAEQATPENAENQGQEQEKEGEPKKRSTSDRYRRKISAQAGVIERLSTELEAEKRRNSAKSPDLPKPTDYPQGEFDPQYVADLAAIKAEQKISAKLDEQSRTTAQHRAADEGRRAVQEFEARAAKVKPSVPDFDEALEAFVESGGQFEPHVIQRLHKAGEKGPMLAYHLAKNPDLAEELNGMDAADAAAELARLEAKVALPQPKRQTQAPSPLKPLTGGASPSPSLHDLAKADNMDAYVKARNEQDKARRR